MHDLVEMYTPGCAHGGTIHVWVYRSVVGNSFGGTFFVGGTLVCKHGAQGADR